MTEFEKFIEERGCEFENEDALRAGYDRQWKGARGILISREEFIAEAMLRSTRNADVLSDVYTELLWLVNNGYLSASDVYQYAHYKWCLNSPSAIICYRTGTKEWQVNNCESIISEAEAKIAINREWGFEVSRIKLSGEAYYDATDWQFIRFDCGSMSWLWRNGDLHQVYE